MTPAQELRFHLKEAYDSLSLPGARIRMPRPQRFEPGTAVRGPGTAEGHFHLRAELFLQRRSATRFRFASETLDLGPGEILIVPSRVMHAETIVPVAGSAPFQNVVVYSDERTLSCHLADSGPAGQPRIAYPEHRESPSCGRVAAWLEDAVRVSLDLDDGGAVAVDLMRSVLGMTLRLLDLPSARGDDEPLTVVRCRRMIHEGLGDPDLSVASLAQRLGCSADYLSHLFRTVRGERLTAHVEELRMLRAAELLAETPLSCKEVAWASGYANQSYFIRCFRKRWNATPVEFRLRKTAV
jgi:AraC-like DNA-binding protein